MHRTPTPRYDLLRAQLPEEWSRDDFVLCGSAVLAAYGHRDVRDLDVMVKPALWADILDPVLRDGAGEALLSQRFAVMGDRWWGGYKDDRPIVHVHLHNNLILDFFETMPRIASCITPVEVWAASRLIDGYRVISPRHCLAVKALADRPRDALDMVALAAMVALEEDPVKPLPPSEGGDDA